MADDVDGFSLDFKQITNFLTKNAIWILIIVAFVVHFNGLFGGFIADDIDQVRDNYIVHTLSNIPRFFTGSTLVPTSGLNLVGPFYRPLMMLSYAVIYALFHTTTFYYHAFQLALHIVNGILLFVLFKKFLKESIALFLSLLFLVHPINAEAVVYIADLQDPLFFCFGLSALLVSMKEEISLKRAALISFLLLCSFLSKESGLMFAVMVIVGQVFICWHKWSKSQLVKVALIVTLPLITYAYLRFVVAKILVHKIPGLPITELSLSQRLLSTPAIVFYYLKTFLYPAKLDFFQIWVVKHVTTTNFLLPLLGDCLLLIAIVVLGIWVHRKQNALFLPYLFFTLWFIVGMIAHSQVIPLDFTVSERFFYFPMVGLIGVGAVVYQSFSKWIDPYRRVVVTLVVLLLTVFSVRTMVRNTNWTDEITLYNHDLAIADSSILENTLGDDYFAEKNYQQAVIHYHKSASIEPALVSYYNIALVYMNTRDLKNAELYYLKALAANKTARDHEDFRIVGDKIYENLTFIYIVSHEYVATEQLASKALAMYPHDGLLWANLAISQYTLGEKGSALNSITTAMTYLPNSGVVQYAYRQITTNQPIQVDR